jgi:nicotinic acid mononucleotide adenylyltransferase
MLKVQVVGGFICPVHPAYGKKGLAPAEDRIEMVKRALNTSDWISCEEWETKQNEWTRTRLSLDRS